METQDKFSASSASEHAQSSSKSKSFLEPDESFYVGVDSSKNWFPEALSPWYYLSGYSLLKPEVRRRYNQLYAVATNEVFAVFEVDFICRILKKIGKNNNLDPVFLESLQRIDLEEEKHARIFHRLNRAAAPEYYNYKAGGRFFASKADGIGVTLLNLVSRFPNFFGVWVWIALIFEERSILYSKFYQNLNDELVDSKFRDVHRLHLIEEVNHVKLDEELVGEFYLKLPIWKRYLTRIFLKRILNSFRSPRRMSKAIAEVLKIEFPDQANEINKCLNELPKLRQNSSFQNLLFGSSAFKRTRKLLKTCPELSDLVE